MKISTRGRYALRMMIDLAQHYKGEPVKLKDVAARQEISEKYCEQIIATLNKAGMVSSTRGAKGGYVLARKPAAYTAGEILRLTEGNLAPVDCAENPEGCDRESGCITRILWEKINLAIKDVVDNVNLEDMLTWAPQEGDDYVI